MTIFQITVKNCHFESSWELIELCSFIHIKAYNTFIVLGCKKR